MIPGGQQLSIIFQAQKFTGTFYAETIRAAFTPKQAAELGRSRKMPLRADWEKVKDIIMLKAVQRKFELHAALRALLLATGEEELVENASGGLLLGLRSRWKRTE